MHKVSTVKQDCIDLNEAIHNRLSKAHINGDISNYLPSEGFGRVVKHVTLDKWALKVEFGKVENWDAYLELHVDSESLELLSIDWFPDIDM